MEKQPASGRRAMSEFRRQEEEVIGSLCRLGNRGVVSPKSQIEQEKRIRREIANSNERRRMQSINAGFQSLRVLLPQRDGEKMSKAAILQHTAEYIYQLEQEKTRLLSQLCSVRRNVTQNGVGSVSSNDSDNSDSGGTTTGGNANALGAGGKMPLKRKRTVESVESADEGIGMSPSHCERELISDLRYQLERERELRKDVERRMQQMVNERDGRVPLVDDEQEIDHSSEAENEHEDYMKEEVTEEFVVTDDLPQDLSCGTGAVNITLPQPQEVTVISKPSVVVLPVHGVNIVTAQQLTPAPSPPRSAIPSRCHSPSGVSSVNSGHANPAVTSRQNLDTIVEAIRHLEGDHLFSERRPSSKTTTTATTKSDSGARSETVIVRSAGASNTSVASHHHHQMVDRR
ncbi:transcription factor AP-4-like isoform X1 [Varroa jacobsoni]|uniref:BHLH domain-containing protein n=1 Tax=Varroa destructor TaxID=109461 RepID=A0A7M7J2T7_VARDE|nr:transcription factor AP-4-like isoform X3 [Varroa destructor]XP_022699106.1 transcription factor AP-4-like isoform X1 [Varroa jacobsoni]